MNKLFKALFTFSAAALLAACSCSTSTESSSSLSPTESSSSLSSDGSQASSSSEPSNEDEGFTVTWKNYDGAEIKVDTNVATGTVPSYTGTTPTKPADSQYTYTFKGWDPAPAAISGNVTYTAQYDQTLRTYTVKWVDYDGTGITFLTDVPAGTTPTFTGKEPSRTGYVFEGWTPTPGAITADTTYTATYRQIDTEVTADEFAAAMSFAGNFTAEWTGPGFDFDTSMYQLDDGSFEYIQPGEDGDVVIAVKREDGNFDYSDISFFDGGGYPLFGEMETITKAEAVEIKSKAFKPGVYLSQVKFGDLKYDSDKGEYNASIVNDDDVLMKFNLKFVDNQLVNATISAEGASVVVTFSDHGKTVLPDVERLYSKSRGGIVNVTDENGYWDSAFITLPSTKAGDKFNIYLKVNVGDLPDGYNLLKDKMSLRAGLLRDFIDDKDKKEYTDDYVSLSLEGLYNSSIDPFPTYGFGGTTSVTKDGNLLEAFLTQYGEDKDKVVEKGVYSLLLQVTLKKDLKDGDNYVAFSAKYNKAAVIAITADKDNGYDDEKDISLGSTSKGEVFEFDLVATFAPPADYDPTMDRFCIDVELFDQGNVYYGDDYFKVTMTYDGRELQEYLTSSYKYRGRLTKSADSTESLPAGTYEVHIKVELVDDLPADEKYTLSTTISCYE